MRPRLLHLPAVTGPFLAGLALLPISGSLLRAADDAQPTAPTVEERIAPTTEYARAKAELDAMLAKRDLGLYEVDFQPQGLKRLVVKDRLGRFHAWHYLTFRLRNQSGGENPVSQAEGYNAVLSSIVAQYEGTAVDKSNGAALRIDGVDGQEGTVIERTAALPATRKLSLSAIASDERGTRLTTLDQLTGAKAAEVFDFPDLGEPSVAMADTWLRDKIEELEGQRLLTTDELRTRSLPPYDAAKPGEEPNWAAGEVFGVFIFPQLSDLGTKWRIEIRGVSNQFRERFAEDSAAQEGGTKDWLNAKIQRRVYVLNYALPGDEFHRDQDRFSLASAGWEWVASYQRYERLHDRAWSEQALETIGNPELETTDEAQEAAFWSDYEKARAARAKAPAGRRLPDLQAELKR